jgi:DNA-damage-inducible protein J
MPQTTLSISIDEDIKRRFDIFCVDAGMNATVAINMFARAVLREKRIPFEITGSDDPFYSAKNQARLQEAIDQLEAGGGIPHELIEDRDGDLLDPRRQRGSCRLY